MQDYSRQYHLVIWIDTVTSIFQDLADQTELTSDSKILSNVCSAGSNDTPLADIGQSFQIQIWTKSNTKYGKEIGTHKKWKMTTITSSNWDVKIWLKRHWRISFSLFVCTFLPEYIHVYIFIYVKEHLLWRYDWMSLFYFVVELSLLRCISTKTAIGGKQWTKLERKSTNSASARPRRISPFMQSLKSKVTVSFHSEVFIIWS